MSTFFSVLTLPLTRFPFFGYRECSPQREQRKPSASGLMFFMLLLVFGPMITIHAGARIMYVWGANQGDNESTSLAKADIFPASESGRD